jgi:hypothetical protein
MPVLKSAQLSEAPYEEHDLLSLAVSRVKMEEAVCSSINAICVSVANPLYCINKLPTG